MYHVAHIHEDPSLDFITYFTPFGSKILDVPKSDVKDWLLSLQTAAMVVEEAPPELECLDLLDPEHRDPFWTVPDPEEEAVQDVAATLLILQAWSARNPLLSAH